MASIIQGNFSITDESMKLLKEGEYIRTGGVIRDRAGHIIEYLKDAPNNINSKNVLYGVGIFAAGCLTATVINEIYKYSNKKKKNNEVYKLEQTIVSNHNDTVTEYLNSISSGTLNVGVLMAIINNLKLIKKLAEENDSKIMINVEQTNELFDIVYNYTVELAKLNNLNLDIESMQNEISLSNIVKCLEYQQQIFETNDLDKEILYVES